MNYTFHSVNQVYQRTGRQIPQKPHSAIHQHCNCSQKTLSDQIPLSLGHRIASRSPFSAVFVPEIPIHGSIDPSAKRPSSVPGRTTLCRPPQDLAQIPSQAQFPTSINDAFDLLFFSMPQKHVRALRLTFLLPFH